MKRKHVPSLLAGAVAVSLLMMLGGCASTISKGVDEQGRAQEVTFPDPTKDATQPEGSYPNSESLSKLRVGLTKTQVQQLIGTPHYKEGFGAREWDYLLHMPSSDVVCQLKLIYNKQMQVGSIHSLPAQCLKVSGQ